VELRLDGQLAASSAKSPLTYKWQAGNWKLKCGPHMLDGGRSTWWDTQRWSVSR